MAANDPITTPKPPAPADAGPLGEYEVNDGNGNTYSVQLSEADAKARGLAASETKAATPRDKAKRPSDK